MSSAWFILGTQNMVALMGRAEQLQGANGRTQYATLKF